MAMPKTHTGEVRHQQRANRRQQAQTRSIALIIGGIVILAVAGFFLFFQPTDTTSHLTPPRTGQSMPDLALSDLSGKMVRLSDFVGQPILINAWATWCPPCRAEMPLLHQFYLENKDEGFVLLAINAGETSTKVSQFIQQTGFSFPVLLDPDSASLERMGVFSFPTSILVGRDGIVKKVHVGLITPEILETEIAPLLGLE